MGEDPLGGKKSDYRGGGEGGGGVGVGGASSSKEAQTREE